ncbi:MAG: Clp protease N-terminal domain-containing protein, partial [Gemmatimonadales bacterium]
ELVRKLFEQTPQDPLRRGFVVACGMDPDALLAERDSRPAPTPQLSSTVQKALALAGEDAARLGQLDVRPENLFIGLLRASTRPVRILKDFGWMEVERFHADLADRLAPTQGGADLPELPMHADAQVVIEAAVATATARRQREVEEFYVLHALTGRNEGPVAQLLGRYGLSAAKVHADLTRWLTL